MRFPIRTLAIVLLTCAPNFSVAQTSQPTPSGAPYPQTTVQADLNNTVAFVSDFPGRGLEVRNIGTEALAAGVIGGAVGGVIGANHGNQLLTDNQISNPSDTIARQLAEAFAKPRNLSLEGPVSLKGTKGKLSDLTKARYTVGVFTLEWILDDIGLRAKLDGSILTYKSTMIVADTVAHKTLLQVTCTHKLRSPDDRLSYRELVANEAAGLKRLFDQVVSECVQEAMPPLQKLAV